MRFVFSIGFLIAFCGASVESIAQSIDISEPTSRDFVPRMHKGKQVSSLKPRKGFTLKVVETGLGNISSIAIRQNGTIFTTDADKGRVWQLSDRNKDGQIDVKQALPHRFDRPTGLAVTPEHLYVADRAAIWVIKEGQPPLKLAGLINANSTDAFHPLALSADRKNLFIGLTTKDGVSNILTIDQDTGQAEIFDSMTGSQQIRAITSLNEKLIWSATEHSLGATLAQHTKIEDSYRLVGLALPKDSTDWASTYSQHVLVSKHSSDGYDIIALPASLGSVQTKGDVLLSGFMSTSGRSAWGRPGALSFDPHGLIIADEYNGDLYRLKAVKPPKIAPEPQVPLMSVSNEAEGNDNDTLPSNILSTITGSQIDRVSGIDSATTIETGSTIIRDYKPLEIEETSETPNQGKKSPN